MSISTTIASIQHFDTTRETIQPTRKRERESHHENIPTTDIDRRPFSIRADWTSFAPSASPADPFAQPRIFTPQCLLGRALLPLAYLDTAHERSRLFTAHIPVLKASHRYHDEPNVLIVEEEKSGGLYAVERVQRHKYALCRLAQHVTKDVLLGRAVHKAPVEAPQRKRVALQPSSGKQPWWAKAATDVDRSGGHVSAAVPQLFMGLHQPSAGIKCPVKSQQPAHSPKVQIPTTRGAVPLDDTAAVEPMIPEQILEELSRQYLEALYLSRTPLAYFVKGPLARARTAMSAQPSDLISFLRGALLTSLAMDKKFRDALPDIVKDIPVLDTPATQSKPRRKRKWKAKRDKQGMFVDEKEYVEQWWRKDDDHSGTSSSNESQEAELKRRMQLVRNRETFLQVIVIMELLALEAGSLQQTASAVEAVPNAPGLDAGNGKPEEPPKKQSKKKEVDANSVLETLIERLNIFHTVEYSPVKTKTGENGSTRPDTKDELKTFAAEVVIPFFASRIFDVANTVSKKLGGPSAPRPFATTSSRTTRKPGEPTIRQPPEKKPRKPLARTSTDTINKKGRQPPALLRSATDQDTLAPLIKREMSETPSLHDITAAKTSKAAPRRRVTGLDQYAASHRQIDLSAMSQANQTKIRKNKDVEDKILRDALNGIRKPNRALATAETARNADESFARALSRSKPKANRMQGPRHTETSTAATVATTSRHIKATPVARRQLQHGSESMAVVPSTIDRQGAAPEQPSSSDFAVPQTGHRPRLQNVAETPSRGFAKFMPMGLAREPGTLIESPTLSRTAPVFATPSRPVRMPSLAETPLARPPAAMPLTSPGPLAQRGDSGIGLADSAGKEKTSIYETLGWTDDYDELA